MQVEGQHMSSNTMVATGARVSNTYATYLLPGDNPLKDGLIPHNTKLLHGNLFKHLWLTDGHAHD